MPKALCTPRMVTEAIRFLRSPVTGQGRVLSRSSFVPIIGPSARANQVRQKSVGAVGRSLASVRSAPASQIFAHPVAHLVFAGRQRAAVLARDRREGDAL